jgi:hypothetical protein
MKLSPDGYIEEEKKLNKRKKERNEKKICNKNTIKGC